MISFRKGTHESAVKMGPNYDFDITVIGAGIAGMVAAVTAKGLGQRVAVIERGRVGGNCTNTTCIPSKTLIRLGHILKDYSWLAAQGVVPHATTDINKVAVMNRIKSVVGNAYEKDRPETFEKIGITMLNGVATFVDRHHLNVNGRIISSDKFIIAVGTRPFVPPIEGIQDVPYLTNETLYELDELPQSLAILGGGVDGLEYASAFGRLGVETTVIERNGIILPMADREVALHLRRTLEKDGIRIKTGTQVLEVAGAQGHIQLIYEEKTGQRVTLEADQLLVALGRMPNLLDLALDKAGINATERGVVTNDTLQTTASNIYACGDVVGPHQLATTAEYQGIVAATNAVMPIKQKVRYDNLVYVIFTIPSLAFLGLTEAQAHAKYGHKTKVYRFEYANMRRALIDGNTTGLGKFICDGKGRLVGAHILGESAPEVIHEAQILKAMKKPLQRLHAVTHAYPTYAQALVGRASQLAFLDMMKCSPFVKGALKVIPGVSNKLEMARDRLAESKHDHSQHEVAQIFVSVQNASNKPQNNSLTALYKGKDVCIISVPTEVMDVDHRFLEAAYAWQGQRDPQHILLDFSNVTKINGLGAAMLVKFCARRQSKKQNVLAFGLSPALKDVFKVSELEKTMSVYDSEEKAFAAASISPPIASNHNASESLRTLSNASCWAPPVAEMFVPPMPKQARNLNVNGRKAVGPVSGFGPLWQKAFQLFIHDTEVVPEEAIQLLKQNFPRYQPSFNHFYPSEKGIEPGEIVLIDSSTPGGPVSTGVMVMYSDERSFTFNTPRGHPECGFVSFSSAETGDGIVVRIIGLARAGDPFYEAAFRLAGSKIQTRIWRHVLTSLALDLGFPPEITMHQECIDNRLRWEEVGNVYYNAQIRTLLNEPKRWLASLQKV